MKLIVKFISCLILEIDLHKKLNNDSIGLDSVSLLVDWLVRNIVIIRFKLKIIVVLLMKNGKFTSILHKSIIFQSESKQILYFFKLTSNKTKYKIIIIK